ncbi:MAG: hypothetical protein HYZ54_06745 [Ignavibacteriae bacterium]|nr:hypothetical protein [Ignavibacteriota bacterium]
MKKLFPLSLSIQFHCGYYPLYHLFYGLFTTEKKPWKIIKYNFIELQKLRLDRSVKLEYYSLEIVPEFQIAPMLIIPFVENAFKHGVNSEQKSHIKIEMTMNKTEFRLSIVNNKVNVQKDISERSGLGIENTKHRLNLIYPSKHLLVINDIEKDFSVSLYINLQ